MKIKRYLTWNTIEVDKCTSFRHSLSFFLPQALNVLSLGPCTLSCVLFTIHSHPFWGLPKQATTQFCSSSLVSDPLMWPLSSSAQALVSWCSAISLFGCNQILLFWLLQPNCRRHKWSNLRYSSKVPYCVMQEKESLSVFWEWWKYQLPGQLSAWIPVQSRDSCWPFLPFLLNWIWRIRISSQYALPYTYLSWEFCS